MNIQLSQCEWNLLAVIIRFPDKRPIWKRVAVREKGSNILELKIKKQIIIIISSSSSSSNNNYYILIF